MRYCSFQYLLLLAGRSRQFLDRLIVRCDPDYIATHEFEKVFKAGEYALIIAGSG